MITVESLLSDLRAWFSDVEGLGKTHFSVRFEPGPRIVRVGACIQEYSWNSRMVVIERMLAFERSHSEDFAVEFDVVPLDAINDELFAEA